MKVRKWLALGLTLLILLGLSACGGQSSESAAEDYYYSNSVAEDGAALTERPGSASTATLPTNRKLIRTIRLDAETEDLTALMDTVNSRVAELGGYVEDKQLYNGSAYDDHRYRTSELVIRIPADRVDEFVEYVTDTANIISSSENVDDVTVQYVDTESHVEALKTEQERLIALLEQADNLEEILQIEDRLTDVRYELENYGSQLRALDNQITYATVHLDITEVQEYTPVEEESFWEEISGGFVSSLIGVGNGLKDLLTWVIVNLPYLVVYGGVIAGIVIVIRKQEKKRRIRREQMRSAQPPRPAAPPKPAAPEKPEQPK